MMTVDLLKAKVCTECRQLLPLSQFYRTPNGWGRHGRVSKCKPCKAVKFDKTPEYRAKRAANLRHRRATDPAFVAHEKELAKLPHRRLVNRDGQVRRQYGLEPEDLARMFEAQGHKCAGCGRAIDLGKTTHIDHDHRTQRVRGLLCQGCNVALGSVADSPQTLRALALYIERSVVLSG